MIAKIRADVHTSRLRAEYTKLSFLYAQTRREKSKAKKLPELVTVLLQLWLARC